MSKKKIIYQITRKQCNDRIKELGNVCDSCGRGIVPVKTVDNGGNPTYWSGCFHGDNSKGAWGSFTSGVKKEVFDLAEKLVCNGERGYYHMDKLEYRNHYTQRLYWFQSQVSSMCRKINTIEYLKKNKTRQTKRKFLQKKNW